MDTTALLSLHTPPRASDPATARRVEEAERRLRLLRGTWKEDLEKAMLATLGQTRKEAWGPIALTINPFEDITRELSVLYDQEPEVYHEGLFIEEVELLDLEYKAKGIVLGRSSDDDRRAAMVRALLEQRGQLPLTAWRNRLRVANVWGELGANQQEVIGLREGWVRVDVEPSPSPRLRIRRVTSNLIDADADPTQPSRPIAVRELRLRKLNSGNIHWCFDVLDLSDEKNPRYEVRLALPGWKLGDDVTVGELGGNLSGDAYPFRRADGRPIIPGVLYHARVNNDQLWDPYKWVEIVEGTIDLAVNDRMVAHAFRDASWPQRWAANVRVAGADAKGARSEVVTDPATVLMLEAADSETPAQPMIGQWDAGADVSMLEGVLADRATRLAQAAGVSPSDVQRLGGTARSGVAISLTNEGKRAQQRRYAPIFQDPDERLVGVCATLWNRATGGAFPEWGYKVHHRELPLSPEELRARREHVLALRDAGLMSQVKAYAEINSVTESQARAELAAMAPAPTPSASSAGAARV